AVSSTGALAYVVSPLVSRPDAEVVGVDRAGKATPIGDARASYQTGGWLSPDGTRIALSVTTDKERRPFAFDLARGTLTPLAPSGKGEFVGRVWSASNHVAFQVFESGKTQLVIVNADDPSKIERVPESSDFWPSAWSRDGSRLIGLRARDIWMYAPGSTPPFQPVMTTPASETHPSWSPDGKWIAYVSDTSGRAEVYVRPYPGLGREIPVSTGGATAVAWSRDGRELFFVATGTGSDVMMAANMANPAQPGKPTRLFAPDAALDFRCNPVNCYAVGTGARQFVTTRDVPQAPRPVRQINLILNWLQTVSK
ncbi:MAG TPA: hypothetical protein VFO31_25360, partial [Vicinamibacterales bacterium]|nr:hypothetical protein [Vicinamibacterales bacterium]